jgi:hypothetical protein
MDEVDAQLAATMMTIEAMRQRIIALELEIVGMLSAAMVAEQRSAIERGLAEESE